MPVALEFNASLGAQGLRYALIAPICLIPVMAIMLVAAARVLPQDLREFHSKPQPVSMAGAS